MIMYYLSASFFLYVYNVEVYRKSVTRSVHTNNNRGSYTYALLSAAIAPPPRQSRSFDADYSSSKTYFNSFWEKQNCLHTQCRLFIPHQMSFSINSQWRWLRWVEKKLMFTLKQR